MKQSMKKSVMAFLMAMAVLCLFDTNAFAAADTAAEDQETEAAEDTTLGAASEDGAADIQLTDLMFQLQNYTYEIITDAVQEDMPQGFTIGTVSYHGNEISAGTTDNSSMICLMARDIETDYQYRFIYDPENELICPYFGAAIKDGYIYTIPVYEGAQIPFGFEEADYVIQTVPMSVYQREDAELTSEEIALGIISDDAYFVFLMMNEEGDRVYYTYDLTDRTFQRALLQVRDAESIADLNTLIDGLHEDIGALNSEFSTRMNNRLTLLGIMLAVTFICIGVVINQALKISSMKKKLKNIEEAVGAEIVEEIEDEEDEEDEPEEEEPDSPHRREVEQKLKETLQEKKKEREALEQKPSDHEDDDDEIAILDLDDEDL